MHANIEEKIGHAFHRPQDTSLALDHITHVQGGLIYYGHYAETGDKETPIIHTFEWRTELRDGVAHPSIYLSRALFMRSGYPSHALTKKQAYQAYANMTLSESFLEKITVGQSVLVRHLKSTHPQGITFIGEPVINFMPWDHAFDVEQKPLVTAFERKRNNNYITDLPIVDLTLPKQGYEQLGIGYVYNRDWMQTNFFYQPVVVFGTSKADLGNYVPVIKITKIGNNYLVGKRVAEKQ